MKTLKIFHIALFLVAMSLNISAQTKNDQNKTTYSAKTESFKVWGKCTMCESRIEKTVMEDGAKSASWDIKTQILTVSFDPSKTNKDALSKKLASVGHDTEKYKASDEVYAKLPSCCHYERNK